MRDLEARSGQQFDTVQLDYDSSDTTTMAGGHLMAIELCPDREAFHIHHAITGSALFSYGNLPNFVGLNRQRLSSFLGLFFSDQCSAPF